MASTRKIIALHGELLKAVERKDNAAIGQALESMKIELPNAGGLATEQLSTIFTDYFEFTALHAVMSNDMEGFKEAITNVHNFYGTLNKESAKKYLMIGLHLMHLLVTNRLADFHMLLEQVDQKEQHKNPYIYTPVRLEQSLNEGAYNKVILDEKNLPSMYYKIFVQILMDTVRNEISSCLEKSFQRLNVKDATQMLLFGSEKDSMDFAQKKGWRLENQEYLFGTVQDPRKHTLDATRLANQNIFYAKQLEMIV